MSTIVKQCRDAVDWRSTVFFALNTMNEQTAVIIRALGLIYAIANVVNIALGKIAEAQAKAGADESAPA